MEWDEKIREIARDQEISMRELARRMDVTQGYLAQIVEKRRKPSSLFKAKMWAHLGGEFTTEILLELLDDETKEFVIQNVNKKQTIQLLKKSWDEKNWAEIIINLANHRNWTAEQLLQDLNIGEAEAIEIMEKNVAPNLVIQYRLWDRINYEKVNHKIINSLPSTISNYLGELNKKNMKRLAGINQRKLDKKSGDK